MKIALCVLIMKYDFIYENNEKIFTNYNSSFVASTIDVPIVEKNKLEKINEYFIGEEVFITSNTTINKKICAKLDDFNKLITIYKQIGFSYELNFYTDYSKYLYIHNGMIHATVQLDDIEEKKIDLEYRYIIQKRTDLEKYLGENPVIDYNLSKLTDETFENRCYDLLLKKGFTDVRKCGKANAPDGGVDIIASENLKGALLQNRESGFFNVRLVINQVRV